MRIRYVRHSPQCGSILMWTVCLATCVTIVLVSCLTLVKSQNQAVVRSQAWNACIPVVEAGIEEAMAHLNNIREASYSVNGWTRSGDVYSRQRKMGDNFYAVQITLADILRPVIVCTGYVRAPLLLEDHSASLLGAAGVEVGGIPYVCRAVRVVAKKQPVFAKAMVAKDRIDMKGNNIETDSFDSSDPKYSTATGLYDQDKAKDNGDVSTLSGGTNIIGVGNANIKGHLKTGPGGSASIGPNGVVGSMKWHMDGHMGIEDGWFSDDMNVSLPLVERPSSSGSLAPISGIVTGFVYKYVLPSGKYELSTLNLSSKEKMAVAGDATLLVNGDVDVRGGIDIIPGASLKMYVAGANATITGEGVNNSGRASNFVYYGLPSNKNLTLPANGDFVGAIYAPDADFKLSGGGSTIYHFVGACVTKTITVDGHYKFHYDEALGGFGPWRGYVIISWVEL